MKAARLTGPMTHRARRSAHARTARMTVLLAVRACGVCGSDLRRWREGPLPERHMIPGHEFAGVVAEVGRTGDRLPRSASTWRSPPMSTAGAAATASAGIYNLCDRLRLIGITPGYRRRAGRVRVLTGEMRSPAASCTAMPAGLTFREAALAEPLSSVLAATPRPGPRLRRHRAW